MKQTDSGLASRLMIDLAGRSGVASDAPPTRYLWIDAFAVLNALDLHCEIGEARKRSGRRAHCSLARWCALSSQPCTDFERRRHVRERDPAAMPRNRLEMSAGGPSTTLPF